jgi:hypothetical protein
MAKPSDPADIGGSQSQGAKNPHLAGKVGHRWPRTDGRIGAETGWELLTDPRNLRE